MTGDVELDFDAAQAAADEGIARSDEAALQQWKEAADSAIVGLAATMREFTSDDVWASGLLANPSGSNTALGARFRAAAARGLIRRTDRVARTAQVKSHGQPITVWESCLFRPVAVCPTCGRS